jgi:hypothetical protein
MLISTAGKIYTAHQENFSDVAEHGLICQPPITVVNMKSFLDHIRSSDTFVELVEYSLATNHAAKPAWLEVAGARNSYSTYVVAPGHLSIELVFVRHMLCANIAE